jgi:uncharacterized Zn finger protein
MEVIAITVIGSALTQTCTAGGSNFIILSTTHEVLKKEKNSHQLKHCKHCNNIARENLCDLVPK